MASELIVLLNLLGAALKEDAVIEPVLEMIIERAHTVVNDAEYYENREMSLLSERQDKDRTIEELRKQYHELDTNFWKVVDERDELKAKIQRMTDAGLIHGVDKEEEGEEEVKQPARIMICDGHVSKKLAVIKALREITPLGLKEAKELAEKLEKDVWVDAGVHTTFNQRRELEKKMEKADPELKSVIVDGVCP